MALYRSLKTKELEIVGLLTTVSDQFHRVSMHGVREELLEKQAEVTGLQLERITIPYPCPNIVYEDKMREVLTRWKMRGMTHVVFGDLFLQDIRKYREEKLSRIGITPMFPVWGQDTAALAKEILEIGFRAVITCVDPRKLEPKFAGREFDQKLLAELPKGVDQCGENGEFHTFVYDGPIFKRSIPIRVGETVSRDGFQFADIIPN